jgi:formylglycine-generating enzyme required for sulfatase activity
MADLSPDLQGEIRDLFLAHDEFTLPPERISLLKIPLKAWPEVNNLQWDSPPYVFFSTFVEELPEEAIKQALQKVAFTFGAQDAPRIADLQAQIDAETERMATVADDALTGYHQSQIRLLSTPRYQLDRRFVQLTLLIDQGKEAQGLRFVVDSQREKFDSLKKLLDEVDDRALILVGGPGSGKTTLLRRLQLEVAWESLKNGDGHIPFFVSLNAYGSGRAGEALPDPAVWLAERWQKENPDLPDFASLLTEGRLLLLLDGLNEIPHRNPDDYDERLALWRLFVQEAARRNLILFSCRTQEYGGELTSAAAPVRQVWVEPLSSRQIEDFLTLYLAEQAADVWAVLRQDQKLLTLFATPFFLRLLVDHKLATGELLTSRVGLLTGFVRRALDRELERQNRLFKPGMLLTAGDRQQVVYNRWATPLSLPQQGALIPKLEWLAYAMQDGGISGEAGQVRVLEERAHALLDHPLAAEIVDAGIQLNVLDKDLTRLEITYLHQLLQEYFAARVLARQPEPARVKTTWRVDQMRERLDDWLQTANDSDPLPTAPTTGWEETTLLAAAMTPNPEQFVTDLIAVNLPLAARCAAAPEVPVSSKLVEWLQKELLARIANPKADLRARIAAAEALGELGDPRFERRTGPHGDYLLPPLTAVPGGTYSIGDDDGRYDDEKPVHPVSIDAFEMGIFPVTNAEYRLFVEAGGYEDERWWETEAAKAWRRGEGSESGKTYYRNVVIKHLQGMTDEAIREIPNLTPESLEQALWLKHATPEELERQLDKWYPSGQIFEQPNFWDDSRFNHPAQPVVGVSWFEARAYCAWLSAQTGNSYRLPTEAEWEAAARGEQGWQYAYGQEYGAADCNTFETHVRRTTPIGVFPGGQTPAGITDLSGNVWEWTSSQYRPYPYDPADGREDPADAEIRRVLRGGSWDNFRSDARAASRYDLTPDLRLNYLGCRVVVRRPPSHLDH